jgi:hypothetical protein
MSSLTFVAGWILCLLPVQASEWTYKDGSNGEFCQTSLKFKLQMYQIGNGIFFWGGWDQKDHEQAALREKSFL